MQWEHINVLYIHAIIHEEFFIFVVVDHSVDIANETTDGTDSGLVDDMTVVLTTTESVTATETVTQTATKNFTQTTTESFTETTTEVFTTIRTLIFDLHCTPCPSPTQCSGAAASTSCSSDTNNTPVYVAVAIVIVGLLITIIVVIVGVLMCRHFQKSDGSSSPLTVKYKTASSDDSARASIVEVNNDLYGKEIPHSR